MKIHLVDWIDGVLYVLIEGAAKVRVFTEISRKVCAVAGRVAPPQFESVIAGLSSVVVENDHGGDVFNSREADDGVTSFPITNPEGKSYGAYDNLTPNLLWPSSPGHALPSRQQRRCMVRRCHCHDERQLHPDRLASDRTTALQNFPA